MDIEKLIERLREHRIIYKTNYDEFSGGACTGDCADAADIISTLQAENEKLRAELDDLRIQWDMYGGDVGITAVYKELEQVKRERDTLVEDFVDYVTGGVPNPAIFCKNRCSQCVDMRGWCTGKYCNGFYPSGASGPEEG